MPTLAPPPVPRDVAPSARIGPNAIVQTALVMRDWLGEHTASTLLETHTPYTFDRMPTAMIPESEPRALVAALREAVGDRWTATILRDAGHRTGDYLLAHRIPGPAQFLMQQLPRRWGFRLLARAMATHAWTFAGSGHFHWSAPTGEAPAIFSIDQCPMCRGLEASAPMCDFYAGTFERLLRALIDPRAGVQEVECEASGGHACVFHVRGIGEHPAR